MTFANFARFARCRNAYCSPWARQMNASMDFRRGIAASPLMRMAAEMRPLQGFAEQRALVICATTRMALGEALDDTSGATSPQAIAVLLNSLITENSSSEMLDLFVDGKCCSTAYQTPSNTTHIR
mmetsp:Transcript_123837/g.194242  ORF Transcript_123837/g.194242 Transcript_123837/m.194242 type:complete len:125 (+) Transcript_123837:57-431(+)|eukprot:CAMPEP_0169071180 /NCGR_PEP_ID=MMETSP1015-20121227/5522_1 /TAXON_ID=342587 /ORGANISM="Karlodinium micrum, Strain CCMP2283" /LENGTH=124 /DNA_ID=CAMNT_0009130249 /DNA_START=54 /DNA_END=428 /DNA_ORIENTATION=+